MSPPTEREEAVRLQDARAGRRERPQSLDSAFGVAEASQRVPVPEVRFADDRSGRVGPRSPADVQQPGPFVPGLRIALEPVEGQGAAVIRVAHERRRDTTLDQVVEVSERASWIFLLEGDPAEIVGGIRTE